MSFKIFKSLLYLFKVCRPKTNIKVFFVLFLNYNNDSTPREEEAILFYKFFQKYFSCIPRVSTVILILHLLKIIQTLFCFSLFLWA